jgi:hypothetical protein
MKNRKVVLTARPDGQLKESDMRIVVEEVAELGDGMVLLQIEHLSIDAFIRTTFDEAAFHGTAELGNAVIALGTARVLDSRFEGLHQGDAVFGPVCAQEKVVLPGVMLQKIDDSQLPARCHLGVLGLTTGMTAYAGMLKVAKVNKDDLVVVSAAAGAVGSCACQIAKLQGATVIGIAGGEEKGCFLREEIGCDSTIDYKQGNVSEQLMELAPEGVDVFFDNVGGEILDDVLANIRPGARIVICGAISQYERVGEVNGPVNYLKLAERNASMGGFTVNYFEQDYPEMQENLSKWVMEGSLRLPEHIEEGIDQFPKALTLLFSGGHKGKLIVAP